MASFNSSILTCLEEYEQSAHSKVKESAWNYYSEGSCLGQTKKENIEAFKKYYILPRAFRACKESEVDLSVDILGSKMALPIGAAPTGRHALAHPQGEEATVKGCTRAGVCMIQSVFSNKSMEEVTESCKGQGLRWMQLQPLLSESCVVEDIIKRAESLGYSGIVITCDQPNFPISYAAMKESKIKNYAIKNPEVFGNFSKEINDKIFSPESNPYSEVKEKMFEPISWDWVDWVRSITTLPIILKGILNPHDAEEALKHDIQAIYVSNHGGRVLDSVPPTLYALPEIIKAVNGKVEVYVDGGIRHGTDVLKALALGARAVFVGKPIIWGLACNGEDGVFDVLQMLGDELRAVMASTGCKKTSEVTPDIIRLVSSYNS